MSSLGLPYPQLGGEYATLWISTYCDIKTQVNGPIVIWWCLHNKLVISIHISQWATVLFFTKCLITRYKPGKWLKVGGDLRNFFNGWHQSFFYTFSQFDNHNFMCVDVCDNTTGHQGGEGWEGFALSNFLIECQFEDIRLAAIFRQSSVALAGRRGEHVVFLFDLLKAGLHIQRW